MLSTLEGDGFFMSKIAAVSRCGDFTVSFKPPKAALFLGGNMPTGVYPHKPSQLYQPGHKCHCPFKSGSEHPRWKGGKRIHSDGYVWILKKDHPFSVQGYVLEHRLVMEKILGRELKRSEVVHHINGVKDDNRPDNLQLFKNNKEHKLWEGKHAGQIEG